MEADDVNGLDVVLPGEDLIEDVIGVDLVVFDDATDLKFFNFANNWYLFGFVVEHQTIYDDFCFDLVP